MVRSTRVIRLTSPWTCLRCRAFATSSIQCGRTTAKLPPFPTRTRFAPSPTGYLHLGSLRTALFNYLLAKATGGQFLLRVEDTDQKRTVADAEERLYHDLRWAGLAWDEGPDVGGPYGPYKQSERTLLHQKHAEMLLESGHAYWCLCSSGRVGTLNAVPGECPSLSKEVLEEHASKHTSPVVRFKMPRREPAYTDLVYGYKMGNRTRKYEREGCFHDPVLLKSDGFPTYHLANVVDDHLMKITHVIRGAEWMSSTPMHIAMYQAFNWQPPSYAHVGLLQDSDRQKYSKRKGDADLDMSSLRNKGVFPEALINYVALHGWSHRLRDDFLRMSDLILNFDLNFTRGNTIIKPNKLDYLQKRYAKIYAQEAGPLFSDMIERSLTELKAIPNRGDSDYSESVLICSDEDIRPRVTALLQIEAGKYTFAREFIDRFWYFFYAKSHDQLEPRSEPLIEHLGDIEKCFTNISSDQWNLSTLQEAVQRLGDQLSQTQNGDSATEGSRQFGASQVLSFLRWAVSYGGPGPPMGHTMDILGRTTTLERIKGAKETLIRNSSAQEQCITV